MTIRSTKSLVLIALVGVVAAVGIAAAVNPEFAKRITEMVETRSAAAASSIVPVGPTRLVEYVADVPDTIRFVNAESRNQLGIRTDVVHESPPPQPLRLPGSLFLDPNRLIHVHSRFSGEVVVIGQIHDGERPRPLRYGDRVTKGQLLATVWSKEIGEKKSELVDAISRLEINRSLLEKLESVSKGIVSERQIMESRREVESDSIAVTRVERTLRSWRLAEEEIDSVKREAELLKTGMGTLDPEVSRRWAETEVRAAIDGVIVEKNFNVGDIVEPNEDLFKIADLSRLQVVVNVYEEDLWAIRALGPDHRKWKLDLKSDPTDNAIEGNFELIGSVIDPAQRTGILIGWLNNPNYTLAVGQFITATIELPADLDLLAIDESALIEEGDSSSIFVETAPLTFTRRKVDVARRTNGTVLIRGAAKNAGSDAALVRHKAGEVVAVSGVLGLGGELANLKADAASH